MNQNQKPTLRLLSTEASLVQAREFIEAMTGVKMTAAEVEELRRVWEDPTPPS